MGLFDKKYCDICGEKIGLLGNRKLDDGNCCKNCAKKLSPFFSERRSSTVAQIKEQLAYRAENEKKLDSFRPTFSYGQGTKIHLDAISNKLIVTRMTDWKSANPDIIDFSQITSCDLDIKENKKEIFRQTADGKRESYNPRRYEFDYEFNIIMQVQSPWFSEIKFELSEGRRPDAQYTQLYNTIEKEANSIKGLIMAARISMMNDMISSYKSKSTSEEAAAPAVETAAGSKWKCPGCEAENEGKFCEFCGTKKPE